MLKFGGEMRKHIFPGFEQRNMQVQTLSAHQITLSDGTAYCTPTNMTFRDSLTSSVLANDILIPYICITSLDPALVGKCRRICSSVIPTFYIIIVLFTKHLKQYYPACLCSTHLFTSWWTSKPMKHVGTGWIHIQYGFRMQCLEGWPLGMPFHPVISVYYFLFK